MIGTESIKIAFFDIDGTLLPLGAERVGLADIEALSALQKKGIRIFLATGRTPFLLPDFNGLHFDGKVCFNGSYCEDAEGVFARETIPEQQARIVAKRAGQRGLPVCVATDRRIGVNFYNADMDAYLRFSIDAYPVIEDYDTIFTEHVHQLMVPGKANQDQEIVSGTEKLKCVRWWDRATDVVLEDCSKARGIHTVLEHYGLAPEEAIAFGDGDNDREMLQYAGIGVAMGNAGEATRRAADYVTGSCNECGVSAALYHLGMLS